MPLTRLPAVSAAPPSKWPSTGTNAMLWRCCAVLALHSKSCFLPRPRPCHVQHKIIIRGQAMFNFNFPKGTPRRKNRKTEPFNYSVVKSLSTLSIRINIPCVNSLPESGCSSRAFLFILRSSGSKLRSLLCLPPICHSLR